MLLVQKKRIKYFIDLYTAFVAVRTRVKFINRDLEVLNNYWVRIFHRAIDDYYTAPRRCEIQ